MNKIVVSAISICFSCFPIYCFSAPNDGINIYGFNISPQLGIHQQYNDNILSNENDQRNSFITVVSPIIKFGIDRSSSEYGLIYEGNIARYASSGNDDYFDNDTKATALFKFSRQASLKTEARYSLMHQDRGSGFSQGSQIKIEHPDEYNMRQLGAIYSYGSRESIGRIEIGVSGLAERYTNRREIIYLGNRNYIDMHVSFLYQTLSNTSLLFEVQRTDIDFRIETNNPTFDNTEQRFMLGAKWSITEMTNGTAKFGILKKDFKSSARDTFTGFSWIVGAHWAPLTYSHFNVETMGKTEETNGTGDFIETIMATANWKHNWNKRLSSNLNAEVTKNSFRPTKSAEGIWKLGVRIGYQMYRTLELGSSVFHSQRLSTQTGLDYKKNVYTVDVIMKL